MTVARPYRVSSYAESSSREFEWRSLPRTCLAITFVYRSLCCGSMPATLVWCNTWKGLNDQYQSSRIKTTRQHKPRERQEQRQVNYTRCSSSEFSRPEVEGTHNRVWSTGRRVASIGSVTHVDYVQRIEPVNKDTLKGITVFGGNKRLCRQIKHCLKCSLYVEEVRLIP